MVDSTTLRLLGNKILVMPKKKAEKSVGGIIIPITATANLEEGQVMQIGALVINVQLGDDILYPSGVGIPYEMEGEYYKFLNGPTTDSPGDIIAII